VILANGGVPDGHRNGEDHFWIDLGGDYRSESVLVKQHHALQQHRPLVPRKLDAQGRVVTGSMLHHAGYNRIYAPSGRFVRMAYGAAP
jgi:hypothetical protein